MMKKLKIVLVVCVLMIFNVTEAAIEYTTKITNLKVEYTTKPIGIDVENPRFSWQMIANTSIRGCSQTGYQIIVTNDEGIVVWNSGKMNSDKSIDIEYKGERLSASTIYKWNVTVWNQNGEPSKASSCFETGLMTNRKNVNGFDNAKWIGNSDSQNILYSHYLPVFRLAFSFQFDKKTESGKASFLYGANDERLMDHNKNIYGLASKKDSSYIKVEIDATHLSKKGNALINIFRSGYDHTLKQFTFNVPTSIINQYNKYDKHNIEITSNLGNTSIFIDNSTKPTATININPLGEGGDFVAFPVLGDIGYDVPSGQEVTFSDIKIRNYRDPGNIIAEIKELEGSRISNERRIINPSRNSMPMLRNLFHIDKEIAKARLYVTARGVYEMYVNGKRVGDDYFNPGNTQYNRTLMYQTYDITSLISKGDNAVGALLAEGWWSGGATYAGENWNYYGDRQSLLAKIVVTYKDKSTKVIVTDPETWRCYSNGPVVYSSIFQGEVYDATLENMTDKWSCHEYNDSAWEKATEISLENHISHDGCDKTIKLDDYSKFILTAQYGQPIKAVKELTAQNMEEVRPGVFVYDMGQNMVGVPRVSFSALPKGTRVNLRFAEVKYPDMPEYRDNANMLMLENIRAAMSQDIYISKGTPTEQFCPHFTYHGYRYLEITGIPHALPIDSIRGIVLSSLDTLTSNYVTSDTKVNRLWQNITWSARGNFFSVPTDCPQRNERLGWAGDISVFSRTATYLATLPQFLRRYLQAMRDLQRSDGRFPDIAPLGGGFGGMLWGSAGITIPWESYQQYGDTVMLSEHYDAMKRYISFILNKMTDPKTGIIVQTRSWADLDDWLGPENKRNDKSLLWESYFIYDLGIMQKAAIILGRNDDANMFNKLYTQHKAFFMHTYVNPKTGETISSGFEKQRGSLIDTQTSYVLPLAFDIPDSDMKKKMTDHLVQAINRKNISDDGISCSPYSLMTGFIGTAWISKVLSDNGCSDIAYHLLTQEEYPSWLYPINQGATTIWERLNSYTKKDGFGGNNRMNSFNHYSFGAVGAWMINYSLGIQRDEVSPCFHHFILQPIKDPTGKIKSASGYYDSVYGRIESSWSIKGDVTIYKFVVPANTTATLFIPSTSLKNITENGEKITKNTLGVKMIEKSNNQINFMLKSGCYEFEVK